MSVVCVVGLGYVGLTMAVCLSRKGFTVNGLDVDENKVRMIGAGRPPFHEPGLEDALTDALMKGRLKVTPDYSIAIPKSEIIIITVGTPSNPDGSANLNFLEAAASGIGEQLRSCQGFPLVVVRSTVPPLTTSNLIRNVLEKKSGKVCGSDFGLCHNPEFLREGSALDDTMRPDRLIIGEFDERSGDALQEFYHKFLGSPLPTVIRTTTSNSELIKLANNAFLAMKISYINQMANLCQRVEDADVQVVATAIGLDKRIGPLFLQAGLGWGGSCFPKDLKALLSFGKRLRVDLPLVEATTAINDQQPLIAIRLADQLVGDLKGKKIAILGLAFKPDTDDMREAVSIKIIKAFLEKGANVAAYDPSAMENARRILMDARLEYCSSAEKCIDGADCCVIVTEWQEFKKLRPEDFARMAKPIVIDGRRILQHEEFEGLTFAAIGLATGTDY